jgi:hypothetical protein
VITKDKISEIKQALPEPYWDLADVFSKYNSNTLPPHHREFNHKVKLEQENAVSYRPLYKINTEELGVVREYILDNLYKRFIVPSNAPFTSPILIVEKLGGGLCFYVNYCKLNTITRKDCYPLPLINKILEYISKAKIFTKLDIR